MEPRSFFLALPLPPPGQVASGIPLAGRYHSVFCAVVLPHKLQTETDVRDAVSALEVHVRLTPQPDILKMKLRAAFAPEKNAGKREEDRRGPPVATWRAVCRFDLAQGHLAAISSLRTEKVTYLASRLGDDSPDSVASIAYSTLVPGHLPFECLWKDDRYELMDFHGTIPTPNVNAILLHFDRLTGRETVVGGTALSLETGLAIETKLQSGWRDFPLEEILARIRQEHPIDLASHLRARARLVRAVAGVVT